MSKHFCQNFLNLNFFMACKFVMTCYDKNVIHDSTIWEKKVIWWHGVLFHFILTWDLVYPYIKKQSIKLTIASPTISNVLEANYKFNKPQNDIWACHTRLSRLSGQGTTPTCPYSEDVITFPLELLSLMNNLVTLRC